MVLMVMMMSTSGRFSHASRLHILLMQSNLWVSLGCISIITSRIDGKISLQIRVKQKISPIRLLSPLILMGLLTIDFFRLNPAIGKGSMRIKLGMKSNHGGI